MTMRVVFLDRASIVANIRRPRAATDYIEYPRSSGSEVVERLRGAAVAITNKVPLREPALRQLPELRMIAVAARTTPTTSIVTSGLASEGLSRKLSTRMAAA